jgi:hypothetical protein
MDALVSVTSGGATAMLPKIPSAKCATWRARSSGMILMRVYGIVRQEAGSGAKGVAGERIIHFDFANPYLQRVPRLSLFDKDRSCQGVGPGALVCDLPVDGAKRIRDLAGWQTRCLGALRAARRDGFHRTVSPEWTRRAGFADAEWYPQTTVLGLALVSKFSARLAWLALIRQNRRSFFIGVSDGNDSLTR